MKNSRATVFATVRAELRRRERGFWREGARAATWTSWRPESGRLLVRAVTIGDAAFPGGHINWSPVGSTLSNRVGTLRTRRPAWEDQDANTDRGSGHCDRDVACYPTHRSNGRLIDAERLHRSRLYHLSLGEEPASPMTRRVGKHDPRRTLIVPDLPTPERKGNSCRSGY